MKRVPIESIRVGKRQVELNENTVDLLMESIRAVGLLQPIGIRPDGTLVYGYHRWEACKRLGWREIPALVIERDEDENDLHAKLAELDENLIRNEFTVLQRAKLLQQRRELYEQLYPDARPEVQRLRGITNLKPFQTGAEMISAPERPPDVPTFVQDTARQLGVSERTVRHELQIATRIPDAIAEQIAHTPLADNKTELLRLAQLSPEDQQRVVEKILSGRYATVQDALDRIRREERMAAPVLHGVYEGLEIRQGDFREVLADIPDRSVDVILTDPPYKEGYLPLWDDLGAFAARVLKPTGVLLAYSGQLHLPTVLNALTRHLRWWWMGAIRHTGGAGYIVAGGRRIQNHWKPLLILTPLDAPPLATPFADLIEGGGRQKELHIWEQSTDEAVRILQTFAPPGAFVVDPFAGSGSFGRAAIQAGMRFLGAEILEPCRNPV